MDKQRERQSNMELLRIVSMMMVLAVHLDGASLGLPDLGGNPAGATARDWWRLAVEALAITGVNCFTMISGYFGIRLTVRGAVRFLLMCAFYSVGIYSVLAPLAGSFTWQGWAESWLVLTHTDLWYVPAYFMLMIVSPVLNAGLDSLGRRQYAWLLALSALLTVWAGWWWGRAFNPTGYTAWQLVLVYAVARYVRRFGRRPRRRVSAVVFVAATLCIVADACYDLPRAYAYNSPFVLVATVALFMLFRGMEFRSAFVNRMASGAFAVYLIHKNPLIWGGVIKRASAAAWDALPLWEFSLLMLAAMAAIYAVCMAVDLVRRRLFALIGIAIG